MTEADEIGYSLQSTVYNHRLRTEDCKTGTADCILSFFSQSLPSHTLQHNLPVAGAGIKIDKNNLLPCA